LQNAIQHKDVNDFMTQTAGMFSLEKWWERLIEKTPVKYLSLVLGVFGGALLYWAPRDSFRHSFGEAAVIAALLVFLVDPFLKARVICAKLPRVWVRLASIASSSTGISTLTAIQCDGRLYQLSVKNQWFCDFPRLF
jgi:predicted membrane protein